MRSVALWKTACSAGAQSGALDPHRLGSSILSCFESPQPSPFAQYTETRETIAAALMSYTARGCMLMTLYASNKEYLM
ncbi:hypothetical protein VTJ04DRAFT_7870 [Mycothermus thermophilus]|uniref:uncharacterized protein n=1 Tax=Humicola insolens TaxID=85995 RepID=UPI00374272E6